jgi:WhiB family transcriptional regulator, redox-sensing transcriptional regulator
VRSVPELGGVSTSDETSTRRSPRPIVPARFDAEGWEDEARCRTEDARLFFGPNRFEPKHERLAREAAAKAICATCPVVAPCRQQALAEGELYGVWGGLGEADRRALLTGTDHVAAAV